MSEVKTELLVKELSARVDELEDKNSALKLLLAAMFALSTPEQSQQLTAYLSEWKRLNSGQTPHSVSRRLKEIESVVGELR
ncbi:hypothetical protein [Enterobacter kobei]|uniref:hypothetical protein n=1 Tax=Enterobacter kobei TaxID=208224 RepID=UPI00103EC4AD|nr:hypothetical protein [Enterobacter kobei]